MQEPLGNSEDEQKRATAAEVIRHLTEMDPVSIIYVLEWLFKNHPHKYDYATMSAPLRRFYDPGSSRPSTPPV